LRDSRRASFLRIFWGRRNAAAIDEKEPLPVFPG